MKQKWYALLAVILVLPVLLVGCRFDEPVHATAPTETTPAELASPYADVSTADLLSLMCECKCDVMQIIYFNSNHSKYTVVGMLELTAECPIAVEFFNRTDAISVLNEHGPEVYQMLKDSNDGNLKLNARGLQILLSIFCPHLFEGD